MNAKALLYLSFLTVANAAFGQNIKIGGTFASNVGLAAA